MSIHKETKLTKLLDLHTPGTVCLASWLTSLGISHGLQKRYRQSGWLVSIGRGALRRPADKVDWLGALYTLQMQASLPIHAGALTALTMLGLSHYLRLGKAPVYLFSPPKIRLPAWFRNHDWQVPIKHIQTSILPEKLGGTDHEHRMFTVRISAPERAILECLYLAPEELDLVECYHMMEGLTNLRPNLMQELLELCTSVKTKRLFLYMAEKVGQQWFGHIDTNKIRLGEGHRRVASDGVYVAKYQLTVPQALAAL